VDFVVAITRLTFCALLVATASATASAQALRVEASCPQAATCVRMELDAEDSVVRALGQEDGEGYTIFSLRVFGALNAALAQTHELRVRGYTGGMTCSAFGQAAAAVIGNGPGGVPIIQTDRGPLALLDSALRIGCRKCARVRAADSDSLVATLRTPAWDLTMVGGRPDSVALSEGGAVLFRQNGAWVDISSVGPFRTARPTDASRTRARYRLDLTYGACT
jgi:hypothetical protein